MNAQHFFYFRHEIQGRASGKVHLVNEGQHGNAAKTAHFKQLAGLRLDPLRGVDHHDRAIGRRERPVGIFAKVLMARRIQDVDHGILIRKLHGRGGDGDAALLLHFHPIRRGQFSVFAGPHHAGGADHPGVEQEFFGQRGFTRVRMADDGKGPPLARLGPNFVLELKCGHINF